MSRDERLEAWTLSVPQPLESGGYPSAGIYIGPYFCLLGPASCVPTRILAFCLLPTSPGYGEASLISDVGSLAVFVCLLYPLVSGQASSDGSKNFCTAVLLRTIADYRSFFPRDLRLPSPVYFKRGSPCHPRSTHAIGSPILQPRCCCKPPQSPITLAPPVCHFKSSRRLHSKRHHYWSSLVSNSCLASATSKFCVMLS
ncbi:hypothetical protein H4582DRAFT_1488104 [Lactarius indigo]|nr:hypothetical protein H4582DRAFT_1488104 [Lactarius indigo]